MRGITITLLTLFSLFAAAQESIYEKSDSIAIERIIKKHSATGYGSTGELALAVAQEFIGKRYIAGTLENGKAEPLYISCAKLDCTTFVELVTAITISIRHKDKRFGDVCMNLERVRYRGGVRNGYASRLHYTSWWIEDNTSKGIIREITKECTHRYRTLDLCFMSKHPESYTSLKEDTAMQKRIEELEIPFRGIKSSYIPKEHLNDKEKINHIRNGDIIALVTTIEGLDISHVGFACWKGGKLHLLHASSGKGEVIMDSTPLFEYQRNKSKQIGIKVIRITSDTYNQKNDIL